MGKFYTVEVKPTIAASIQHAEAFASGELLFDWTEFEVPKGTVKLINTTIMIRPKGDAGPTANSFPGQLIFIDAGAINFNVKDSYVDLLQLVLITVIGAYFGGRSLEKVKK